MFRKIIFILFLSLAIAGYAFAQTDLIEPIEESDRILILAPHPDDEAIACAGIIQQALDVGADVHVAYLTNGDHNEFAFIVYKKELILTQKEFIQMGQIRRKEAIEAMKLLGLDEDNLIFLGYPDFGTFTMFKDYWQSKKPFKHLLTRISNVPYKGQLSYGAPYKSESILSDLEKVLRLYSPNKIFVSHPADVNCDHKAFYLFLEVALANLSWELPRPKIYPYLIHVVGWPTPRHYHPELTLEPPKEFLDTPLAWSGYKLTPKQLQKKHQAILCYRSQTASSAFYLLAFARKNELFSAYPAMKVVMPVQETNKWAALKEQVMTFLDLSIKAEEKNAINAELLDSAGKNKISYSAEGDNLLIKIRKTNESANRRIVSTIYLFGYSYDRDFADMPKITIITKYTNFKVFNAKKLIKPEGMSLDLSRKDLILKIPMKLLGNPDFVLASVRAYTGALPMDTLGFCKIQVIRRK